VFLKLLPADHRWSAGGLGRKSILKIVSDTEPMKIQTMQVYAKTAVVAWPSTESRRISSFRNFLSFNRYFRKYFKVVYRKCGYGNFNHWYNVFPVHLRALLGVGNWYEGDPRVRRPPIKWSAIAQVWETPLDYVCLYKILEK
jgi:hypothetical protein